MNNYSYIPKASALERDTCGYPSEDEIMTLCEDDNIKSIVHIVSEMTPEQLNKTQIIDFGVVLPMIRARYQQIYGSEVGKTYAMNFLVANCKQE